MPPKTKASSTQAQSSNKVESDMPPEIQNQYKIVSTLGQGNFAEVQHVIDRYFTIDDLAPRGD